MSGSEEIDALRATVGMIAHVLNELTATVGGVNENAVVKDEVFRKEMGDGLTELAALTARIAKTFQPFSENGG